MPESRTPSDEPIDETSRYIRQASRAADTFATGMLAMFGLRDPDLPSISEKEAMDHAEAGRIVTAPERGTSIEARIGRLCRRFGVSAPSAAPGTIESRLVHAIEIEVGSDGADRSAMTTEERVAALEARD